MNSNIGERSTSQIVDAINSSKCFETSSLALYNNNNLDLMSTEKISCEVSSLLSPSPTSSSSSSSSSSLTDYNKNNNNNYDNERKSTLSNIRSGDEAKERARPKASKSPTTNQHVAFCNYIDEPEEKRKKYLTAKYGQHQMALIKKRLQVEMWLYEKLQDLSKNQVGSYFINVWLFLM